MLNTEHKFNESQMQMIGEIFTTAVKGASTGLKEVYASWVRAKALDAAVAFAQTEVIAGEPSWSMTETLNRAEYLEEFIKHGKRANRP